MNRIEVKNVSKYYGATAALEEFSVTLEPGHIYGLLGRNGAGKTTLLNILTGRTFADSGSATLGGAPIVENDAALSQLHMQSEQTLYPDSMRVREALKWAEAFYPGFDAGCAQAMAEAFGLDTGKKFSALSTGYRTIAKLVVALSTGAPYLLLDEPVLGLDANHRELLYKTVLARFAETGACIVLSTHLVEEVSRLVEQVVIIKRGRLLLHEERDALLARGYTVSGPAAAVDAYIAGREILGTDVLGGLKSAHLLGERDATPPAGLEVSTLDLQRLFVQLTN